MHAITHTAQHFLFDKHHLLDSCSDSGSTPEIPLRLARIAEKWDLIHDINRQPTYDHPSQSQSSTRDAANSSLLTRRQTRSEERAALLPDRAEQSTHSELHSPPPPLPCPVSPSVQEVSGSGGRRVCLVCPVRVFLEWFKRRHLFLLRVQGLYSRLKLVSAPFRAT